MAVSYAKAGASYIAIGARSSVAEVEPELKAAASDAGKPEPHVLCLNLDISDEASVSEACQKIEADFGKLDVVINNAGVIGDMVSVEQSRPDSWWQTCKYNRTVCCRPPKSDRYAVNINVKGSYLVMRACLPLLLKGELRTVATVASVGAFVVTPALSDYQTSKLAAVRVTEFFAKENADQGVIAFSIHPGNILTDMIGKGEGMDKKLKAVFTETPELCGDSLVYLTKQRREWISGR